VLPPRKVAENWRDGLVPKWRAIQNKTTNSYVIEITL
jgi:hypothetical protein